MNAEVVSLHIASTAAASMQAVDSVRAVPGKGLKGDRYFEQRGTFSKPTPDREVTLIESEALEVLAREAGIVLEPGASRRNITTRGVSLNDLVGKEFRIGEVGLRGLQLCEPCAHLEKLTGKRVVKPLTHRGGLRAQVMTGGVIRVGDGIVENPSPARGEGFNLKFR
jgi:MOSC domain-containing protein YiiM